MVRESGPRAWAFAAAAALLVLHAFAYLHWTEDDAGITLRYVDNLVAGQGLVYNPGERVEGISNLGYALLLVPFRALLPGAEGRLELFLAAKLIGLVAGFAGLFETDRLGRALGLGGHGRTALLFLVAGSAPWAAWTIGALETPFVTWAALALMAAAAEAAAGAAASPRPPARRLALACSALVLLRADGFVVPVTVALALALVRRSPRSVVPILVATGATLAAVLAFRIGYYGEWWPNPVHAKVELRTALAELPTTWRAYLSPFLLLLGGWPVVTVVLAWALAAPGASARPRQLAALVVLGVLGYPVLTGRDWMPHFRFLVPAIAPALALLIAAATALVARQRSSTSPAFRVLLVAGLVALEAAGGHHMFRRRRAEPLWYREPTLAPERLLARPLVPVRWLRANVPPDGLLLTSEAGFVPWLSALRTIDSFGLTDPRLARLPRSSVHRSTLGIDARFTAAEPAGAAELRLAEERADAVLLLSSMVRQWNDDRLPPTLWGGRYEMVSGAGLGHYWTLYRPAPKP